MAIPIFFHFAFATEALPIAAVLAVRGRRPPDPYRRVAIWAGSLMIIDLASQIIGSLVGNNLFLAGVFEPVEAGLTLWILATWQPRAFGRLYITMIPLMGIMTALALVTPGFSGIWDAWLGPSLAILMLIASLQTLIQRALSSRELLTDTEWFWICIGLSIYWFSSVPLPPFLNGYVVTHEVWVWRMLYTRSALLIVAFCLITWGVLCTRNQLRFSGPL